MNLSITPTIEVSGSGFTASWPVTEDWSFGKTKEEAVKNLAVAMVEGLTILENEVLGPLMKKKMELLKLYVYTTATKGCYDYQRTNR